MCHKVAQRRAARGLLRSLFFNDQSVLQISCCPIIIIIIIINEKINVACQWKNFENRSTVEEVMRDRNLAWLTAFNTGTTYEYT